MIEHKILKTIHLKYSGRAKENAQINRISRHRARGGRPHKNCNYLEVADGNKNKETVRERNTFVI